jgi:hypothetical protein
MQNRSARIELIADPARWSAIHTKLADKFSICFRRLLLK